jgi:corrinoid protein of di/trimethylamine methyltransferase
MTDTQTEVTTAALRTAFVEADFDRVPRLVKEGVDRGVDVQVLLDDGLVAGIREVGEMFRRGEAFLPEMMLAAEAWQSGMDVLEPLLAGGPRAAARGKVVIGTVKGDIHSLGKDIVATMLRTAGFEVIDLGVDVAASKFVAAARDASADIIALCALMTTTIPQQKEVMEHLAASGCRSQFLVMIGGASTTSAWAAEIGADAHGETAADAVSLAEAHCSPCGGSSAC